MKHDRIAGRVAVLACLNARRRRPRKLYLLTSAKGLEDIAAAQPGLPVEYVDRRVLDKLSGGVVHQGVLLDADPLPIENADRWEPAKLPAHAPVIVLDSVEDPHNFGAIVRSAAAFGASAVVFGKDRAAPISPAAQKAGAGGFEAVQLVQATNLVRALDRLRAADFWIVGLAEEARDSIWTANLTGRIALVVGNEGSGLRPLVRKHCDLLAAIPLAGQLTSLNASVAAAVALAEISRRAKLDSK